MPLGRLTYIFWSCIFNFFWYDSSGLKTSTFGNINLMKTSYNESEKKNISVYCRLKMRTRWDWGSGHLVHWRRSLLGENQAQPALASPQQYRVLFVPFPSLWREIMSQLIWSSFCLSISWCVSCYFISFWERDRKRASMANLRIRFVS